MSDEQVIKQLQKQIDMLSSEMRDHQQKLLFLQQELGRLQNKKAGSHSLTTERTSRNFRFENFIGLRVIHFVGIVLLVIGLSIGVKYVIDRQLISEPTRISLAYVAGIILYLLSWRLKKKLPIVQCHIIQRRDGFFIFHQLRPLLFITVSFRFQLHF